MMFPGFKDRSFSKKVIATTVLLHFVSLMMAARFDRLWLTQLAFYGTLTLYLILMPVLWLWHRVTKRKTHRTAIQQSAFDAATASEGQDRSGREVQILYRSKI